MSAASSRTFRPALSPVYLAVSLHSQNRQREGERRRAEELNQRHSELRAAAVKQQQELEAAYLCNSSLGHVAVQEAQIHQTDLEISVMERKLAALRTGRSSRSPSSSVSMSPRRHYQ